MKSRFNPIILKYYGDISHLFIIEPGDSWRFWEREFGKSQIKSLGELGIYKPFYWAIF